MNAATDEMMKLKLGGRAYYVSVNSFQGSQLVHIRKHYEGKEKDGRPYPSRFGATLNQQEWMELMDLAPYITSILHPQEDEQSKNHNNYEVENSCVMTKDQEKPIKFYI